MEVEVKLRLQDAAAHEKVAALLATSHEVTHLQENVFFDGANQELSSKRMVLRLRFYNGDGRCVVSLKGKAVIIDGISRGSEVCVE
jgi:adenylate cyclase class IV